MTTAAVSLTPEQQNVLENVTRDFSAGRKEISIGGLAGTGKTVLVRALAESFGKRAAVVAPTGKAAQVLRNKGIEAETIHSAIYQFLGVNQERDEDGNPVDHAVPKFEAKDSEDVNTRDVFLCDESSMVNAEVHGDLTALGVPIVWVGDHGQLPPVGADPGIMASPDYVLHTIHRQAAESPIVRLAHWVRGGRGPEDFRNDDDRLGIYGASSPERIVRFARSRGVDVILCAFNQTRTAINAEYRRALGYGGVRVAEGDRLVCLKNNRRKAIYNGMIFTVRRVADSGTEIIVDIEDDTGTPRYALNLEPAALGGGVYDAQRPAGEVFDYAYALTVHKSQGSEWKHVLVVDQPCRNWDMARWRYTAYTRAKERLTIVKG